MIKWPNKFAQNFDIVKNETKKEVECYIITILLYWKRYSLGSDLDQEPDPYSFKRLGPDPDPLKLSTEPEPFIFSYSSYSNFHHK